MEFYVDKVGLPDDPVYYAGRVVELSTYFGEPYGHSGRFDKLMHLGNTCIPALREELGQDNAVSAVD
jgi:hypothetical protein